MRKLSWIRVSVALVTVAGMLASPAQAVSAKAGGVCRKAGTKSGVLTCAKGPKGLRWVRAPAKPLPPTTIAAVAITEATATKALTATPTTAASPAPPSSATARSGSFIGAGGYRAAGDVDLVTSGSVSGLRLRNAAIQSGPALVLYLTPQAGAVNLTGAVRIGPLTSLTGSSDYNVPAGTEIGSLSGVLIWCDRFSVPFGVADLR